MIMTLFDRDGVQAFHRARGAASGQHHPGQDRDPIGLIALARKFVILDPEASPKDSRAWEPRWLWVRPIGCCASAMTAPPRHLSMTRHHPSDPRGVVATPLAPTACRPGC